MKVSAKKTEKEIPRHCKDQMALLGLGKYYRRAAAYWSYCQSGLIGIIYSHSLKRSC